jgi:arylsulfatase A-like enzyme
LRGGIAIVIARFTIPPTAAAVPLPDTAAVWFQRHKSFVAPLGCNGNAMMRTPGMDSLAEEGMRFTSAFTPTSLCIRGKRKVALRAGRRPGYTPAGTECDAFVSLVDLMPTLLDMAGVGIPEGLAGRSLLPWLRGESVTAWPDDVFAEFHGYESALFSQRMVRTRGWKYVYNPGAEDELYDVESDPGELRNLAPDLGYRHVLRRMKARLRAWMERTGDDIAADDSGKGTPCDLYLTGRER